MSLETKIAESLRAWFSAQQESDPLLRSSSCERYVRDLELLAKVRAHPALNTLCDALGDELHSAEVCLTPPEPAEYSDILRTVLALLSPGDAGRGEGGDGG